MKKVKIMLTAIIVMAVVGGALAFKAKSDPVLCIFTLDDQVCSLLPAIITEGVGQEYTIYSTLTEFYDGDCPEETSPEKCEIETSLIVE